MWTAMAMDILQVIDRSATMALLAENQVKTNPRLHFLA
jgi:hypothetical protein